MKIAFLPNWCKYLSLAFFILSLAFGIDSFIRGYNAGLNDIDFSEAIHNEMAQSTWKDYISDMLVMLSIIIYILSKDKNDDDYINVIRGKSLLIALLIGVISCFIAYGFDCHIQGIWLLLIQFISYIIIFKISKAAACPSGNID